MSALLHVDMSTPEFEKASKSFRKKIQDAADVEGLTVEEFVARIVEEASVDKEPALRANRERMEDMVPRVATALLEEFGLSRMEEDWAPNVERLDGFVDAYIALRLKVRSLSVLTFFSCTWLFCSSIISDCTL